MADTETVQTIVTLPVVPLPDAVLLPGTVATLTLDSDDAKAAVAAATSGDGRVIVVPVVDGRMPRVGVIAQVEQAGQLPERRGGRHPARRPASPAVGRGHRRAQRSLAGGRAADRGPDLAPRRGQVRELRVVLEEIAALRRSRRLPEILRTTGEPGALADAVTAWSEASNDHQLTVLEATEVGARVELVLAWAKDHLAELKVNEQIRADVTEGVEKQQREYLLRQQLAAIRKELGEDDDDPSTDYRARLAALTTAAEGARARRQGDRPAGAHQRSEPGAELDPHLARPRARPAVGHDDGRQPRPDGPPVRCSTPTTTASTT